MRALSRTTYLLLLRLEWVLSIRLSWSIEHWNVTLAISCLCTLSISMPISTAYAAQITLDTLRALAQSQCSMYQTTSCHDATGLPCCSSTAAMLIPSSICDYLKRLSDLLAAPILVHCIRVKMFPCKHVHLASVLFHVISVWGDISHMSQSTVMMA